MPILDWRSTYLYKDPYTIVGPALTGGVAAWNVKNNANIISLKNSPTGASIASVGDYLRIKASNGAGAVDENWMLVSAVTLLSDHSDYTYTLANGSTSKTFSAGTAVARYKAGPSGTIYMSSDDANGPFLSVQSWASVPWTAVEQVRIGNLRNWSTVAASGYNNTDAYGLAAGKYAAASGEGWVSVDATNGVRLGSNDDIQLQLDTSGNITLFDTSANQRIKLTAAGVITVGLPSTASESTVVITGGAISMRNGAADTEYVNISSAGVITVGRVAASQGNVLISSGAISMRVNTTTLINLSTAGDLLVGQTGASQSNVFITAGAVKLRNNTTDLVAISAAGVITVGQVAASQGNVLISGGALQTRLNTVVKADFQTTGNVLIGSDTSAANTTALAIFNTATTYNSEAGFAAGDILVGSNSASKANMWWDASAAQLKFRGGTATKAYIDTTGAFTAGAGAVTLDDTGLTIAAHNANSFSAVNAVEWQDGSGNTFADIYAAYNTGASSTYLNIENSATGAGLNIGSIAITAIGVTTHGAKVTVAAEAGAGQSLLTLLVSGAGDTPTAEINGTLTADLGINVGSATGAATGQIKTSDDIFAGGRVYGGNQTGAPFTGSVTNIANNGVAQVADAAAATGLLVVSDLSSGHTALFILRGGLHATDEVSDPANHFSATKNTATSVNVYWDTTNARYEIQNFGTGGTHAMYIWQLAAG